NQDEGEPEKNRIKKCFLYRVLHRSLVHERQLKVEVRSADEEKKEQDDVGDRRVEVARDFAGKKSVELTHLSSWAGSMRVSRVGDDVSSSRSFPFVQNPGKDCFGETPKPARETRALPRT